MAPKTAKAAPKAAPKAEAKKVETATAVAAPAKTSAKVAPKAAPKAVAAAQAVAVAATAATPVAAAAAATGVPAKAEVKGEHKEHTSSSKVPNVTSKLSEKEQARLQAQIGNLKKVGAIFIVNETNETKRIETNVRELDLTKVPTIYFKNCNGGNYVVNQRVTKILIEGCKNTTITLDGDILTRTVEVWKCEKFTLNCNQQVKTLQLDLATDINLNYSVKGHMGSIVWASVENIDIKFGDLPANNLVTGFKEMLEAFPDSRKEIDQFIVRFLDDVITPERCVRLANGFLSTDREATDWEKRNTIKKDAYVATFLKESGLNLNKSEKKKIGNNEECPCGSGKKYKRCCMNKIELTGVVPIPADSSSVVASPATPASDAAALVATPAAAAAVEAPKPAVATETAAPAKAPAKAAAKKNKKK